MRTQTRSESGKRLRAYQKKRDFSKTTEPKGSKSVNVSGWPHPWYVVQEHHARRLHYDFRLELDGVLKSWAVPKGPSLNPKDKRLAIEVEDHPLDYAMFEGTIPEGEYGAGEVYQWDRGQWFPPPDVHEQLKKGRLEFTLKGKRLSGRWLLVRTKSGEKKNQWLLIRRENKKKSSETLKFIPPQLARLVETPPEGKDWIHEIKFDGYRIQAHIQSGTVRLWSRNGNDWTENFSAIAKAMQFPEDVTAILDGEVVWQGPDGKIDFQALQNSLEAKDSDHLLYYVFDLLYLNREDYRLRPLKDRKAELEKLIRKINHKRIRFSESFKVSGKDFYRAACAQGLEGIVSKRLNALYASGRNDNWVKVKCKLEQEFVIGGYTEPRGSRIGFGALLLGVYEHGRLRYAGRVGTGFNTQLIKDIKKKLEKIETKKSPFAIDAPKERGVHWVKPELVAEVAFSEWTSDQRLRAPVFRGLRSDKPPEQIVRERPQAKKQSLSNPDKIYFKKEKITKEQVADYYRKVARWILPHVMDRPLALVRCPDGTSARKCFFQKHKMKGMPESIGTFDLKEKDEIKQALTIHHEEGLVGLVQWGTIEIHTWNCRYQQIERPDQIVMDFDPGPGVSWNEVLEAAFEMKSILDRLKLKCFTKLSGGKGIHVHIPFQPLYTWDQVKSFARALAEEVEERRPDRYVTNMSKRLREKRIFVDYLRNGRGATAIAPYCLRARDVTSVAMPLTWKQLRQTRAADEFNMARALDWLKRRRSDPWKDYFVSPPELPFLSV